MAINIKKSHRGKFTAKWKRELGGPLSTSNLNLGQSFAKMNNLPQGNLLPSGLAGTNNPGGKSGGLGMSFDPISLGLNTLTAIGGSIGANMATQRADMYSDAGEDMRQVDMSKAMKGSGLQAFLQNPLSFGIGGRKKARLEAEEFNENIAKQQFNKDVGSRFSTMPESPTYTPVARQGGFTVYKGETHEGPNGGILTDEQGNPSGLSNNKPIALTEKNEVARFEPSTGSTYIYSDSLGFAKPATRLVHKYKLDKDNSLYKNDPLLKTAVDRQFDNLMQAQEFAKGTKTKAEDAIGMFRKGGNLTATKAGKMLEDNSANGHPLTKKQKAYFGWIRGGRKEEGGELLPILQWGGEEPETIPIPKVDNRWPLSGFQGGRSIIYDPNAFNYSVPLLNNLSWSMREGLHRKGQVAQSNTNLEPTTQTNMNTSRPNAVSQYQVPNLQINPTQVPGVTFPSAPQLNLPSGFANVSGLYDRKTSNAGPGYYNKGFTRPYSIGNMQPQGKTTTGGTSRGTGVTRPSSASTPLNTGMNPMFFQRYQQMVRDRQIGSQTSSPSSSTSNFNTTGEQDTPYNPTLSPLGHVLSGAGQLADYFAMKNAKPTPVSLSRVGAERISLAKQRLANTRNAESARSINAASTRGLGLNAGSTYANTMAANTGVNRLLGQQNAELLQNEENANAQMQQQANMVNAELAAQEALFNTQQSNAYRAMMAARNPTGNLARTAAGYFADNASYGMLSDIAQMHAPDYELSQNPESTKIGRLLGFKNRPVIRPRNK
jgi:hypothetical protein